MINKTLIMPRKKQVRQQNIKYDNQNTKYANQNTKYANQKFTLFCREAIFVANLRTFLAYFLQAKKYGGIPKRTNIRYVQFVCHFYIGCIKSIFSFSSSISSSLISTFLFKFKFIFIQRKLIFSIPSQDIKLM